MLSTRDIFWEKVSIKLFRNIATNVLLLKTVVNPFMHVLQNTTYLCIIFLNTWITELPHLRMHYMNQFIFRSVLYFYRFREWEINSIRKQIFHVFTILLRNFVPKSVHLFSSAFCGNCRLFGWKRLKHEGFWLQQMESISAIRALKKKNAFNLCKELSSFCFLCLSITSPHYRKSNKCYLLTACFWTFLH